MKYRHLSALISKKFLVLILGLGVLTIPFLVPYQEKIEINPSFDYRFHVPSEFSINGNIWSCIKNNDNITSSISNPTENATFKTTDSINVKGNLSINCDGVQKQWFLDNQTTPFANGDTANLKNLAEGKHNIKFKVVFTNSYAVESNVNINIEKPRVAGVVTPTPNSPVVTPPVVTPPEVTPPVVYQPPTVSILRPSNGASFTASTYDQQRNLYVRVGLAGSATDPQYGNLGGSNVVWSYTKPNGQVVTIGNGLTTSVNLYAPNCSNIYKITLKATNSHGLSSETTIKVTVTGYCPIILY